MSDPVFGTLLIPIADRALANRLKQITGWRVATFEDDGAGYKIDCAGWSGFVDFATAPLPFLDAALVVCTGTTRPAADALVEAAGLPITVRQMDDPLDSVDRSVLESVAVRRYGEMLGEVAEGHAQASVMRAVIDDLRTNFSLLESYLRRHDVLPLRKIWHVPFREDVDFDVSIPFSTDLPISSWGLTRLQLWIAGGALQSDLVVQLSENRSGAVIETWSVAFARLDQRAGWLSFDLERSLASYGIPLRLEVAGSGWRLGGSAPWCRPSADCGGVETFEGPAIRAYATLPGVRGPQNLLPPVDDRRRSHLLAMELSTARALDKYDGLEFEPVSATDRGLLVHPVAGGAMVAVVTAACPALAVAARVSVLHGHSEGAPFLVTMTPGIEVAAAPLQPTPRVDGIDAIGELGPLPAGTWCRIEPGAQAQVTFSFSPSPRPRDVLIATRAADRDTNLSWATITGIEFVLADG